MKHILKHLKDLTIFSDEVDKMYGRTDTLHLLDYVNELSEHKELIMTLLQDHIKRLEFCEYKYRGMEESKYTEEKLQYIQLYKIMGVLVGEPVVDEFLNNWKN